MNKTLEITIPVLNEEARLSRGVKDLVDAMKRLDLVPRIVIADNGSRDKTLSIAEELVQEFPDVRLVSVPNPGVGLALKSSWTSSGADWVGYVDVDHSTDLKHLADVVKVISEQKYLVCTGSRLLQDSQVVGRSLRREIASRAFNFLLAELLEVNFTDGMCGFKFIQRNHFLELVKNYPSMNEGWFFNTEMLVKSEWSGKPVFEFPVTWTDNADSRVQIIALAKNYFRQILRLRTEKTFVGN